ncbi:MAG: hypothetical protein EOP87_11630 [Verrucomicrobiaceae bacterium]|nr:MAG: hypothetical protein EOP87_11630 [Verrucomicrobiaceae bacterium]
MPGNDDALLDATVGDVADLELRIGARRELGECIVATDESTVSRALDRFAKVKRSSRPDLWRWILLGVVLILSLSMGTSHVTSGVAIDRMMNYSWEDQEKVLANARQALGQRGWTRQQEAFLFGEAAGMSTEEKLLHLRRMAEQDPVMLMEYVRIHMEKKSALPPDFRDLANKIDPDNAVFDYLKAALLTKNSIKAEKRTRAKMPVRWEIKEPGKLSQAISSLADATAKPAFNSHLRETVVRRTASLPWATREERLSSAFFTVSLPYPVFALRSLSVAISAEAQRLAKDGDRPGFSKLAAMSEIYWQRRLTCDDPTLVNGMMLQAEIAEICQSFGPAAAKLGMAAEEKRYLSITDHLEKRRAARDARTKALTGRESLAIKTSAGMAYSEYTPTLVKEPPPLNEHLLLPTSYADHALYSRVLTVALWVLLGLSAGILMIHHATAPRMIRTTGRSLVRLLYWRDYAIISVISFLLPLAFVMAVSRLTPYGAREFNLTGTYGLMPAAHFASLFIMMVTAAILTAQWRIRRRAAFFGLGRGWPTIITWIALAAAMLHVPLIGWYVTRETLDRVTLYSIPILLVPGLISLVSVAFRSSFGSFQGRLGNDVLVRVLVPSFGLIMIGILPLLPLFEAEENYWFRQDRFVVNLEDPVFPFTYEKAVAERFNEEIRQMLETE